MFTLKAVNASLWGIQDREQCTQDNQKDIVTGFYNSHSQFVRLSRINIATKDLGLFGACLSFITSPVWLPLRAICSVAASILNIVRRGESSIEDGHIDNTKLLRAKAMGCSLLSLLITPLNMLVEEVATISHIIVPGNNKIDYFAAHLWSGFIATTVPSHILYPNYIHPSNADEEQPI
jgi:hypothetical protein